MRVELVLLLWLTPNCGIHDRLLARRRLLLLGHLCWWLLLLNIWTRTAVLDDMLYRLRQLLLLWWRLLPRLQVHRLLLLLLLGRLQLLNLLRLWLLQLHLLWRCVSAAGGWLRCVHHHLLRLARHATLLTWRRSTLNVVHLCARWQLLLRGRRALNVVHLRLRLRRPHTCSVRMRPLRIHNPRRGRSGHVHLSWQRRARVRGAQQWLLLLQGWWVAGCMWLCRVPARAGPAAVATRWACMWRRRTSCGQQHQGGGQKRAHLRCCDDDVDL